VALIEAVREAVGPDVDVMVDCLLSDPKPNSILYMIDLARRLEEFRPTWLEEPLNFDDFDAHAKLAASTSIPITLGEHFYTRWQFRQVIERGAATVLQPDPNTAGGITEMRKIIALASAYGMPVVPHANESCRNALHLLFAATERTCPLGEWGTSCTRSPRTRSGSRLVTSSLRRHPAASSAAIAGAASTKCSKLSRSSRSDRDLTNFDRTSRTGRPPMSRIPNTRATAIGTRSGSEMGASSTRKTSSAKSAMRAAATSSASRVFPTPPVPVSVTNAVIIYLTNPLPGGIIVVGQV
jgi:hypothetical protein